MTGALLECSGVHKRFGGTPVLGGVDFRARAGELVAILGENGSGKTTLLRILAGAERFDRGAVRRTGAIGYAPQDQLLHPHLRPDEHVDLFAAAYGLPRAVARARAEALMERFGLLAYRRRLVHKLSGGTRQKLNLLLALLDDPPLLLLDEPYAGLDAGTYARVLGWLDEARAAGKGIVLVTHILFERGRFDAVYQLTGGRLAPDA